MDKQGLMDVEYKKTILRMIQENGNASAAQLCATLGASAATIHRDLAALTKGGIMERMRGGILVLAGGADDPYVLGEKAHRRDEKAKTARTALNFVSSEVHSALFGASATVTQLGLLLRERRGLVFLTNGPEIALELVAEGLEVTLVGGQLRARILVIVGPDTSRQVGLPRVDVAFIGVSAIDVDGLSSTNAIETGTKTTIIAASRAMVTLGDHSKLGKRGLARVTRAGAISVLAADVRANDAAVEALRSYGLEITITEG